MTFTTWQNDISQELEKYLKDNLTQDLMGEVIRYSVFPTGKLFRPMLVYSFAHDIDEINKNHKIFACSLEMHHTYTLIHDDLPAMDDDDMRRGRASSHIKFNQWKAILAGDALLNLSYQVLGELKTDALPKIIKTYGEYMGPNGLILGQALDLNSRPECLEDVLTIHKLKTARLIQLAFLGSNDLTSRPVDNKICLELGYSLGICFQLLDDLCELTEPLSEHEKEINPFLQFSSHDVTNALMKEFNNLYEVLEVNHLDRTKAYIDTYIDKIISILEENLERLHKHVEFDPNILKEKLNKN